MDRGAWQATAHGVAKRWTYLRDLASTQKPKHGGKDSDAGREWGQEEKGTTENEMDGWHHQLDGHEFE